jgi:adenylosuccinate synthase
MAVDVIIGLQRGDEGKGRFVDMMAEEHDIVARYNGGSNAGHTVVLPDGRELALHQVPSGIAHPHTMNVIGNGTLVDPVRLIQEIDDIESNDIQVSPLNLMVSSAAHLVLPHHIYEDQMRESGAGSQGSTRAGISQVASHKAERKGLQVELIQSEIELIESVVREGLKTQRELRKASEIEDIQDVDEELVTQNYLESAKKIGKFVTDTVMYVNLELRKDKPARVLAEGAQAFLLDIDHGMYPYTTSSSTTSGGVTTGLGVPPRFIRDVTGVVKAVQSHVGGGPFVTEITDPRHLERLHGDMTTVDAEKGTTTGRIRRLGHLDLPQIRRANLVNGTDGIALSKLDWVPRNGDHVAICTGYEIDGAFQAIAPSSAPKLERATPVYDYLPTWKEDIQDVRDFGQLPPQARKIVEFLETGLNVPITMIGVGPKRDQVIVR